MAKKKTKTKGFESSANNIQCDSCKRAYDITLGGWVILASGQLICDPVDSHECWEKVATLTKKKQGLTNANTEVR